MEVNGFVHPSFECVRDFFHGVDHGGDLDIQSIGKQSLYLRDVTCLGLVNQVLEFGKVCLETVILSSGGLP